MKFQCRAATPSVRELRRCFSTVSERVPRENSKSYEKKNKKNFSDEFFAVTRNVAGPPVGILPPAELGDDSDKIFWC